MSIKNFENAKLIPNRSIYDLLKDFNLYDEVEKTLFHLNIKYIPYRALLNYIAPNTNFSLEQNAMLIFNAIKHCDPSNPNYDQALDEKITSFGVNYVIDKNNNNYIQELENFYDNRDDFDEFMGKKK